MGTTPNAINCKILNINILKTNYDYDGKVLTVSSPDVLEIENKALGYKVKYLLQDFEYNFTTRIAYYSGVPTFEELDTKSANHRKTQINRQEAYLGSSLHFYKSLLNNQLSSEGFNVYHLVSKSNPQRLPDSVIDKNIEKYKAKRGSEAVIKPSDSLFYWQRMKKLPKKISVLNTKQLSVSEFSQPQSDGTVYLNFDNPLYVVYTKAKENQAFIAVDNLSLSRPKAFLDMQVSVLNFLTAEGVIIQKDGNPNQPKALLYEGYWGWKKVADTVPLNYQIQ